MVETNKKTASKSTVKKTSKAQTSTKKAAPKKPLNAQKAVADTEKAVDSAVEKITAKATQHVDPKLRDKAKHLATEAEAVAAQVEKFGDSVGSVTDSILPAGEGSEGKYTAEYTHDVSRLFIFRCLWLIIQGPVVFVRSIWYCLISIVHYISMFLTGRRTKSLREKQTRYRRHVIAWKSYMNALTDRRPAIIVD